MKNSEGITLEEARKLVQEKIKELCAVQPMDNVNYIALANDPIAQALMGRFFTRCVLSQTQ